MGCVPSCQSVAGRGAPWVESGELETTPVRQGDHTPLHFAAGYNQPAVVTLLLQRGAQLELRDKARWVCDTREEGGRGTLTPPLPSQWGKAPVDWALQSKSKACVQLLCAEATARGVSGGRGQVAPLRTLNEFFYSLTDEEVAIKVQEMNDKVVERTAKGRQAEASRENRVTREVWNLRAE